jgi:hypothetical protein
VCLLRPSSSFLYSIERLYPAATGDSADARLSSSHSSGEENKTPSAANAKGGKLTASGKTKFVALATDLGELRTSSIRSSASTDRLRNLAKAVSGLSGHGGGGFGVEASFNDGFTELGASPGSAAAAGNGSWLRADSGSFFGVKKASPGGGSFGVSPLGKAAVYDPHADEASSVGSTTPSNNSFNKFRYARFIETRRGFSAFKVLNIT